MAQKFKFKLDGLLKVREFKEKQIKLELGAILNDIEKAKGTIEKAQRDIEECYNAQEQFVSEPAAGRMVQFFPQFIQSKREEQKIQQNILYALEKKYNDKIKELATAKGDIKVLDNLKDKQKTEFTKIQEKKFQEQIDELTIVKKHREGQA